MPHTCLRRSCCFKTIRRALVLHSLLHRSLLPIRLRTTPWAVGGARCIMCSLQSDRSNSTAGKRLKYREESGAPPAEASSVVVVD
jgi:hypothetical protein